MMKKEYFNIICRYLSSLLYQNSNCCCKYKARSDNTTFLSGFDTASLETYKTKKINESKNDNIQSDIVDRMVCNPEQRNENCNTKSKCYQYKTILQRVRSLLDEIQAIKKNETSGICDFCKRYNSMTNCKRCEFMAKKLGLGAINNNAVRLQRFDMWLSKVKQLLYTLLEREVCQHKLYHKDTIEVDELTNLLNQLKIPLDTRKPYICHFLCMETIENLTESKDILDEVLAKIRTVNRNLTKRNSEDIFPSKYFIDRNSEKHLCICDESKIQKDAIVNIDILDEKTISTETKTETNVNKRKSEKLGSVAKTKDVSRIVSKPAQGVAKAKIKSGENKVKRDIVAKSKLTSEEALMAKMLKSQQSKKERTEKQTKKEKVPVMPKIMDLPVPKPKKPVKEIVETDKSESVIQCTVHEEKQKKMVKGTEIVPYEGEVSERHSVVPMLFKVQLRFAVEENLSKAEHSSELTETIASVKPKSKPENASSTRGIVKYMLSDTQFIDNGWTLLPTRKMMRRVNIYKMVPAKPQYDWFKKNQIKGNVMYDSGDKFGEIDERGNGRWYYKNGKLALDYYSLEETSSGFRYVIYSSGENDEFGRKLPVTVLASFDYLGNGIIYDHYGNERLKYNQSEGIVIDEKIGPPGRWKWHTLNDPPVIIPVFADSREEKDPCFQSKDDKSEMSSTHTKEPDLEMIAIELDRLLVEKSNKLKQKFKPLPIKMKALKINDEFSLKISDQSNISLVFRHERVSVKLNLGLMLKSDEIVDADNIEVLDVSTPYDIRPPRSQSLADIQTLVQKARILGKTRFKLQRYACI